MDPISRLHTLIVDAIERAETPEQEEAVVARFCRWLDAIAEGKHIGMTPAQFVAACA
jgi:hypothetical protein